MIDPKDNLENIQRRGDHLTVALTLTAIILVHSIGFVFPAYHASYTNILFDIVNVVLLIPYAYFAYQLWISTFENYEDYKTVRVVLSTLAIIAWVLIWGARVTDKVINGGV